MSSLIFSIDDRVSYVSGRYGSTHSNPLKGGDYECEGTVTSANFNNNNINISVDWDNGEYNVYSKEDLEHACVLKSSDPNKLWRKEKI